MGNEENKTLYDIYRGILCNNQSFQLGKQAQVEYRFDCPEYAELKEKYHMDIEVETVKENQESFDERKDRRILPNIIKLLEHENQHEAADVLREHLHEAVAVW